MKISNGIILDLMEMRLNNLNDSVVKEELKELVLMLRENINSSSSNNVVQQQSVLQTKPIEQIQDISNEDKYNLSRFHINEYMKNQMLMRLDKIDNPNEVKINTVFYVVLLNSQIASYKKYNKDVKFACSSHRIEITDGILKFEPLLQYDEKYLHNAINKSIEGLSDGFNTPIKSYEIITK